MVKEKNKNLKQGFTLLELLVVVLIIGILAAIALPQYKKAVLKSRYATLKNATKSIAQSQELFYLTNNRLGTFYELDIDLGEILSATSTKINDDIYCALEGVTDTYDPKSLCSIVKNNNRTITYQERVVNSHIRECLARTEDTNDIYNKLCQQETGLSSGYCSSTQCSYPY